MGNNFFHDLFANNKGIRIVYKIIYRLSINNYRNM